MLQITHNDGGELFCALLNFMRFKFAIASDLHITLPHTVFDHPGRFHLVEYSIPAFEVVLEGLSHTDIDFLLLPGDLTQHGEPENHQWLSDRLQRLPYPVFVIPGNHDVPTPQSMELFPSYYSHCGYGHKNRLYYSYQLMPEVRLLAMNSNWFDAEGNQRGRVDDQQLDWLEQELAHKHYPVNLVMIHHNLLNHVPGQNRNPIGQRYILENAAAVCEILHKYGVQLVFTGHLHVQDIAYDPTYALYDITTGSLVSYPHPYRLLEFAQANHTYKLDIISPRVSSIPEQSDLLNFSREWMANRSSPFVRRLLMQPPLNLSSALVDQVLPHLRYFWSAIADGDAVFTFPDLPEPARSFLEDFSDRPPADNQVSLTLPL